MHLWRSKVTLSSQDRPSFIRWACSEQQWDNEIDFGALELSVSTWLLTHTHTDGVMDHKSMLIVDVELLFGESVKVEFYRHLWDYFLGTKEVMENFLSDMRKKTWKGVIALWKCLSKSMSHLFKGDISEKIKSALFFFYVRCKLIKQDKFCDRNSSLLMKTTFQNPLKHHNVCHTYVIITVC